jgi:hypothetical protein
MAKRHRSGSDGSAEKLLEMVGLQQERPPGFLAPMFGAFVVGGVLGVTLGLFLAPGPQKPRKGMGERVDEALAEYETTRAPEVAKSSPAARGV